MKLRFTGEWPPQRLWQRYPNWEHALEEEGTVGQDETTLRPAEEQGSIGADVAFTAGEVELPDGSRLPALVELLEGTPSGVTAFTDERDGWSVL